MGQNIIKSKFVKSSKELVDEAVKLINNYQQGKILPIKTRYKHFNEMNLGGIKYGDIITLGGSSGCVDAETEYFNGTSWVKIKDYIKGDKVLQATEDGFSELVEPIQYHKIPLENGRFYKIETEHICQVLTSDHNVAYVDEPDEDFLIKKRSFGEISFNNYIDNPKHYGYMPLVWQTKELADDKYTMAYIEYSVLFTMLGNRTPEGTDVYEVNSAEDYNDIVRVLYIAKKGNIIEDWKVFYIDSEFVRIVVNPKIKFNKQLHKDYIFLGQSQKSVVINSLKRWSYPYRAKLDYFHSTQSKVNAEIMQLLFCSMQMGCKIECVDNLIYIVKLTNVSYHEIKKKDSKIDIKYPKNHNGYKYCFTVPSGLLILRREGKIFITGNSGKTHVLQEIEVDFLNKELNPNAGEHLLVRCNWEMKVDKLLSRRFKNTLKRGISEIMYEVPNDEDRAKLKKVCDEEREDRILYLQDIPTPAEFYEAIDEIASVYKDKKHILVTIDHIALIKSTRDKKTGIDETIEYINELRHKYANISFIIVTQLNREIEKRTDVRQLAPNRSDLYQSDTIYHISDVVLIIHNPKKMGHDRYMLVSGLCEDSNGKIIDDTYAEYAEYMDKPELKQTNFLTKGIIFWHYIKKRDDEIPIDLAIEKYTPLYAKNRKTAEQEREERSQAYRKLALSPNDAFGGNTMPDDNKEDWYNSPPPSSFKNNDYDNDEVPF